MWVDYRGPLSTVYNDGEISTCGQTIEVHLVQSTMMGRSQHVGKLHVEAKLNWSLKHTTLHLVGAISPPQSEENFSHTQ